MEKDAFISAFAQNQSARASQIADVCISAIYSILENTQFSFSDGVISVMVAKQDIEGVINLLRVYWKKLTHAEQQAAGKRLANVPNVMEELILLGETERYTQNTGQTNQTVSRLSWSKLLSAKKQLEILTNSTSARVIAFHA